MAKPVLSLQNINFSYNNQYLVLDDVSFDIMPNEYICIVGHNGSGKSTISKVVAGLLKPQQGSIYIDGLKLTSSNINHLRKNIGVIFQNPDNQFIGITTEFDIAFGLENHKVKPEKMGMIIENSAKLIDITNLLKKEASDLSGGQKQKVAITSILALCPQVIIFDESTSMLDPYSKIQIKKLMKRLQTEFHRTILSITHDMEELKNATRILCMNKGKVAKYDTLDFYINNYNFLIENSLDLANNLRLSKLLIEGGIKVKPTLDEDALVEQLCK